MADENILRSYRSSDAARRASAAASAKDAGGSDPLAELARLIGQGDPFADLDRGRGQGSGSAPASRQQPTYASEAPRNDAAPADWRKTAAAMARDALHASPTTEQHYAQVDSAIAAAKSLHASPEDHFTHSDGAYDQPYDQAADPRDHFASPAYTNQAYADTNQAYADAPYADETVYADGPRSESHLDEMSHMEVAPAAQDNENYFFDGAPVPAQPGFYDDPPRPRAAGGLTTALVVVGSVILGTAGAFGYRTYYSGVRPVDAPIISADKSPNKVVPASTGGDAQSGKSIQERVGGGNERVVTRQEEPIALAQQPLFPAVTGAGGVSTQPGASTQGSPPAAPAATVSASGESKKVRTISIHPLDGVDPLSRPITAATNTAAAAPAPAAPTSQTATPHQGQATRTASAAPHNNGPLSLDPQGQPSPNASSYQPVAQDRPRPAASAPQLASAASSPAGAGGYMVQISSQRSEADAQASIRSLQSKYASQLGDREAVVRRADLGDKGVYYRAMVGPFGTAGEADQFCGSLKAAGGQCVRLKN